MNNFSLIFTIVLCCVISCVSAQTKVKKQYEDKNARINVVKQTGVDDYSILDEQFGDVAVGKVIRIGTEKPKVERVPKEKPAKAPKPKVKEEKPVKKEAVKKAPVQQEKKPVVKPMSSRKPYNNGGGGLRKYKMSKKKPLRTKKYRKNKKYRCFQF